MNGAGFSSAFMTSVGTLLSELPRHAVRVPLKYWTATMPKIRKNKMATTITLMMAGMELNSALTQSRMPGCFDITRSGRSARKARRVRRDLNEESPLATTDAIEIATIAASSMFQPERRYALEPVVNQSRKHTHVIMGLAVH